MTTGILEKPTTHREVLIRRLFDSHALALEHYVTGLLGGDRHTAADVVQETALRAWRHADRLDAGSPAFRAWLRKVARRLVIDRYRNRSSRPAEIGGEVLDHAVQVGDTAERTLTAIVLSEALASLPRIHRDVIVELYLRGSSVADAARVLRIPAGTVKSRTYNAMRTLRAALADRGLTGP